MYQKRVVTAVTVVTHAADVAGKDKFMLDKITRLMFDVIWIILIIFTPYWIFKTFFEDACEDYIEKLNGGGDNNG